ncbi:MAG: hypothetical protein ACM3U2_12030 [Deltaproteobacteria bacterium]
MKDIPFEDRESASEFTAQTDGVDSGLPRAWAMIENGRYQPRRIKGSCLGRELG